MFANHSVADVLKWVNKGLQIQQEDDCIRQQALSAEHHLLSGFVSDQSAKAAVLAEGLEVDMAAQVHGWVDSILNDAKFLEPLVVGSLRVTAAGDDEGKNILIEGGGALAEVQYDSAGKIKTVQVALANGLMIGGRDLLWRALVGECSWGLHFASQPEQVLQDAILLACHEQWPSIEGADQREVAIPEGAAAVVEVGLYGSIKVVWAEALLAKSIMEDGPMEIFDCMGGLAPGRYLCAADHYWEGSESNSHSYLVSEIVGHELLVKDQAQVQEVGGHDWITIEPGLNPHFSQAQEDEFVLVRLHSGDILHPMHPCDVQWGPMGIGTVAQYKMCKSSTAYDLFLTRRFFEIFYSVQSTRPFLHVSCTYTRNEDWVIEIDDKAAGTKAPLKIVMTDTNHQTCYSKAMQHLLRFVQN